MIRLLVVAREESDCDNEVIAVMKLPTEIERKKCSICDEGVTGGERERSLVQFAIEMVKASAGKRSNKFIFRGVEMLMLLKGEKWN